VPVYANVAGIKFYRFIPYMNPIRGYTVKKSYRICTLFTQCLKQYSGRKQI